MVKKMKNNTFESRFTFVNVKFQFPDAERKLQSDSDPTWKYIDLKTVLKRSIMTAPVSTIYEMGWFKRAHVDQRLARARACVLFLFVLRMCAVFVQRRERERRTTQRSKRSRRVVKHGAPDRQEVSGASSASRGRQARQARRAQARQARGRQARRARQARQARRACRARRARGRQACSCGRRAQAQAVSIGQGLLWLRHTQASQHATSVTGSFPTCASLSSCRALQPAHARGPNLRACVRACGGVCVCVCVQRRGEQGEGQRIHGP